MVFFCASRKTGVFSPGMLQTKVIKAEKSTSFKSLLKSFSQTACFGGVKQKPEIRLC